MSRTISFTLFNLLLAFFPLMTLLAANPQLLSESVTNEILLIGGACLGLFVVVEVVYLLSRRERIPVLLFFGVFLLFLWRPILGLVGSQGVLALLVYWGTVLVAFGLAWWWTRSPDFTRVLAFGLAVYAAFPVVQVMVEAGRPAPERTARLEARGEAIEMVERLPEPQVRPDIYFLMFDCTTSTDMFLERIDASGESTRRVEGFLDRMGQLGFENLADSWSNYERTDPSLFSFFNFVYHDGDDGFQWYQKYYGFRQSALRLYLRKHGYRIVSAKKDIPCPEEFDECYPVTNQLRLVSLLAGSTPFLDVIFKLDKYVFTPLESNALRSITARLKTTKLAEVDEFVEWVEHGGASGDDPEFVYAHFYSVHPVNYYDANCETESMTLFEQRSGDDRVEDFSLTRYGSEYLCFLKKVVEVAEAIHSRDPEAWILVFSDHGYGAQRWGVRWEGPLEEDRLDETFRIMNLVKASPTCERELASVKSSVNKSRALVNCLAGEQALPYLPDQVDLRFMGKDTQLTIGSEGYRELSR